MLFSLFQCDVVGILTGLETQQLTPERRPGTSGVLTRTPGLGKPGFRMEAGAQLLPSVKSPSGVFSGSPFERFQFLPVLPDYRKQCKGRMRAVPFLPSFPTEFTKTSSGFQQCLRGSSGREMVLGPCGESVLGEKHARNRVGSTESQTAEGPTVCY